MERHHTQLECQTGHHKHQTKHQHLVADLARVDRFEHLAHVECAGGTVQHGQAVQQETAGHGTQHKILHGGFGGGAVVTAQSHQCVAGQSQQLKAQVDHQEVVAGDHDEHAQQGKHAQREHLTAAQHATVTRIRAAVHQRHHHGNGRKTLEPVAHGVADHHVAKTVHGAATVGVHHLQESNGTQRQQGQHIGAGAARTGDRQVHQQNHTCHHQ